jgi:hypothetical protein
MATNPDDCLAAALEEALNHVPPLDSFKRPRLRQVYPGRFVRQSEPDIEAVSSNAFERLPANLLERVRECLALDPSFGWFKYPGPDLDSTQAALRPILNALLQRALRTEAQSQARDVGSIVKWAREDAGRNPRLVLVREFLGECATPSFDVADGLQIKRLDFGEVEELTKIRDDVHPGGQFRAPSVVLRAERAGDRDQVGPLRDMAKRAEIAIAMCTRSAVRTGITWFWLKPEVRFGPGFSQAEWDSAYLEKTGALDIRPDEIVNITEAHRRLTEAPPSVLTACNRFVSAPFEQPADRLIDAWIGIDALVGRGLREELRYREGLRVAYALWREPHPRKLMSDQWRTAYEWRSAIVHGDALPAAAGIDVAADWSVELLRQLLRAFVLGGVTTETLDVRILGFAPVDVEPSVDPSGLLTTDLPPVKRASP